ncbi:hypothetical protein ACVW00_002985 [Marmoricola sp. URHA0025 HA25]
MYYAFALLAVVIVAGVVLAVATGRLGGSLRRHKEVQDALLSDRTATLEYLVPTGQDPAVVIAALHKAGFTAATDPAPSGQRVLIECPEGVEHQRGDVRSIIESANRSTQQEGARLDLGVRFSDEA